MGAQGTSACRHESIVHSTEEIVACITLNQQLDRVRWLGETNLRVKEQL